MDAGSTSQTTESDLQDLTATLIQHNNNYPSPTTTPQTEWLAPSQPTSPLRRNRRFDVYIHTKALLLHGDVAVYDEEGVEAPRYIPTWVLPQEDLDNLRAA